MTTPTRPEKQAALSRALSEFLIELSIGVHRYAMYPPDHPSLEPVTENIVGRLAELFAHRETLAIGVAQRQLVIDQVATDPGHPVLSDLARRLHEHQVGALTFSLGVTASEVGGLLGALAADTATDGLPLGVRPPEEIPTWDHAAIRPVGYDTLEIREGEGAGTGGDRATDLWLGLARAAVEGEETDEAATAVQQLARTIERRSGEAAYEQVIAGYLRQLAHALKVGGGQESETVRGRVSALVSQLDDATLARLVEAGVASPGGGTFLLDANQCLAVDSVMKLLRTVARSSGQTISHSMTRLLSKLAAHAEGDAGPMRSQADTALRANVDRLLEEWNLSDPNPEAYTGLLDALARSSPDAAREDREEEPHLAGSERVLRTALEVDGWGPTVERALQELLETGEGTAPVLALADSAPRGSRAAERLRAKLTEPGAFRALLAADRMDEGSLRMLVDRMGEAAVEPLLDVLAESDSRSVRRKVFDRLVDLGPSVGARAVARLTDGRWFVLRNMLALLQRLDRVPSEFDPRPFLGHADVRVRREALPLALAADRPGRRERALALALADADERMVRMALLELEGGDVPEAVIPTLLNRVVLAEDRRDELRSPAVRCLAGVRAPLARKALTELAVSGRSLFGKPRLASGSDAVAALEVLASTWGDHEEVAPLLEEARGSRDPAIRTAVEGVG